MHPFIPVDHLCSVLTFRVEPDLRSTTYCYGIKNGGYEEWEFAFNRLQQATLDLEKIDLLAGLSCTQTPWILNK